ncbi:hypothetical protein ISN45_Aa02g026100 [Arabidopsis thaliana x Arabidopsis arenosa]|uniref:Uncharacterized protein n=1 Tax=Arabidopsis thaliana x Arabidopsis arenosa TaxID=1240361 RepID=A0A8T2BM14_9BRAS|nr:hypothetical protein ISN45_Aa02g026100 [Arabidopsis thaliana x Arabidopsis arenosa]KAG7587420.1 hypothetical protein ISN45_Aa02g026100 [Arabidopsis thaliana x Arabidopsis arenosa]
MGKIKKANQRGHIATPYPSPCCKKEWAGSTCPVCLESPHNAVLLLCSSYHKGCRPYMCATSSRFANCLDQYRKSYSNENSGQPELLCPLCRGQVKGWTVVKDARMHFNSKRRTCMQDNCSFVGNFRKLKKHMKEKHPHACPRAIDPALETKWKRLERERDRRDVISTIMSSTPGAVVLGDYVIEPHNRAVYDEEDEEEDYSSDDSLSNGILDLDSSWQGQSHHIRFLDMESSDFASSSSSPASPSRSLHRLLFPRNQRGGNRGAV